MVLLDVFRLALVGIAIALPAAFVLGRLLRSQLFGVSPSDPFSLAVSVLLITAAAFVAALVPARRAVSVDPMQALRTE